MIAAISGTKSLLKSIRLVAQCFRGRTIDLPNAPGVYAFWWMGKKAELMSADRHMILKGPSGRDAKVEYKDWWPPELPYPCLYVGKSTNIKKRFALHIKRDCLERLHCVGDDNRKLTPCTTSCQLRYGIEHVFRKTADPLGIIFRAVGFSYSTDSPDNANAVAERFYEEDRLVGTWRPWFNIDSER
jgi:hypothetical protein